jgi:hypothetical protein
MSADPGSSGVRVAQPVSSAPIDRVMPWPPTEAAYAFGELVGAADQAVVAFILQSARRASIIRLASATVSSVRLFSRLEGLSANARVEPGEKIDALQPFPTELSSIRYPLY